MLDASERTALLAIARAAVIARAHARTPPSVDQRLGRVAYGAFVTLKIDGVLRGCIGQLELDGPLAEAVQRVGMAAAAEDPRFQPVRPEELPAVAVEVSVLGPLQPCVGPSDVEIGRHGLVVEDGPRRGLLLPQVAVEWGWDSTAFLSQTCIKAGLRPDAWETGITVLRFEAEVFEEPRPTSSAP